MKKISETINRKFIETLDISNDGWEVESDTGFVPITHLNKTIPYDVYDIKLEDDYNIKCADTHILMQNSIEEVFAKDSFGEYIDTKDGKKKVLSVENLGYSDNMYDISVDSNNHTYYTNDILSHNTVTIATYLLWRALFGKEENIGIAANKLGLAVEILDKMRNIFLNLPIWLSAGIKVWNKRTIEFENGCRVMTSATNGDSFRGYSLHLLYVDECAFISGKTWKEFEDSVFPTVAAIEGSQIIITSTANGLNHFYQMIKSAKLKKSTYKYNEMQWYEVPGRDDDWRKQIISDNGLIYFNQNFGNEFVGSSSTLIDSGVLKNLPVEEPISYSNEGIHNIRVYEKPKEGHNYVIGVDPAKEGLDYFAFNVLDVTSIPFKQVMSASLHINYLELALPLYNIAIEYNEAYMIIENNEGAGQSLNDMLFMTYEYENIFKETKSRVWGYRTTTRSRKLMLTQLKALIESDNLIITDKESQEEFFHFLEIKGKFQADAGYHDDLVMSLGISVSFLNDVKNFEDMKKYVEMLNSGKRKLLTDSQQEEMEDIKLKDILKIGAFESHDDSDYTNKYSQYDDPFEVVPSYSSSIRSGSSRESEYDPFG